MKKRRRLQFENSLKTLMASKPEAKKVENRYRAMRYVLEPYYPILFSTLSKDSLIQLFQDVVYLDRKIRKMTEGVDEEKKQILSQEFQIDEGLAEVGFHELSKLSEKI